jgi:hypothetical protein
MVINVYSANFHPLLVLVGQVVQYWRNGSARVAPISPEVEQHRLSGLEYFGRVVAFDQG